MDANESLYVFCHKGAFVLPDRFCRGLRALMTNDFVYLREDDEVLTISATRIEGGYRRVLSGRFRSQLFRTAKELAIVNLPDSLRVMAIS